MLVKKGHSSGDDLPESNRGSDIDYASFVRTRKHYWMDEARKLDSLPPMPNSHAVNLSDNDSEYIVYTSGPDSVVAVFEDSGDVGWFYLYDSRQHRIVNCTHVYNGSDVKVTDSDVNVLWSNDRETGAVAVFAQMRAFLGVTNGVQMREPIRSLATLGIPAEQWPKGFEYALLK